MPASLTSILAHDSFGSDSSLERDAKSEAPNHHTQNHITYALVDRWLLGSWRTASSFSSSLFRRVVGTEREGIWVVVSSNPKRACITPDWGEASCEPERPGRLKRPGGEVKLDMEYRLGREKMEGNPELSRYSGGVVGSD